MIDSTKVVLILLLRITSLESSEVGNKLWKEAKLLNPGAKETK